MQHERVDALPAGGGAVGRLTTCDNDSVTDATA
jgi:hypothetical protein